jgi:hypothetical protein
MRSTNCASYKNSGHAALGLRQWYTAYGCTCKHARKWVRVAGDACRTGSFRFVEERDKFCVLGDGRTLADRPAHMPKCLCLQRHEGNAIPS